MKTIKYLLFLIYYVFRTRVFLFLFFFFFQIKVLFCVCKKTLIFAASAKRSPVRKNKKTKQQKYQYLFVERAIHPIEKVGLWKYIPKLKSWHHKGKVPIIFRSCLRNGNVHNKIKQLNQSQEVLCEKGCF